MRLTSSKYKEFRGGWTICYWSGLISSHKRTKNKKKTFDTIFGSYLLFTKGNKKWGVPEM